MIRVMICQTDQKWCSGNSGVFIAGAHLSPREIRGSGPPRKCASSMIGLISPFGIIRRTTVRTEPDRLHSARYFVEFPKRSQSGSQPNKVLLREFSGAPRSRRPALPREQREHRGDVLARRILLAIDDDPLRRVDPAPRPALRDQLPEPYGHRSEEDYRSTLIPARGLPKAYYATIYSMATRMPPAVRKARLLGNPTKQDLWCGGPRLTSRASRSGSFTECRPADSRLCVVAQSPLGCCSRRVKPGGSDSSLAFRCAEELRLAGAPAGGRRCSACANGMR
jgi:hypothetical protein